VQEDGLRREVLEEADLTVTRMCLIGALVDPSLVLACPAATSCAS
jgi:hypothetical protein